MPPARSGRTIALPSSPFSAPAAIPSVRHRQHSPTNRGPVTRALVDLRLQFVCRSRSSRTRSGHCPRSDPLCDHSRGRVSPLSRTATCRADDSAKGRRARRHPSTRHDVTAIAGCRFHLPRHPQSRLCRARRRQLAAIFAGSVPGANNFARASVTLTFAAQVAAGRARR